MKPAGRLQPLKPPSRTIQRVIAADLIQNGAIVVPQHGQGEHIFNAVDALADGVADILAAAIVQNTPATAAANQAVQALRLVAAQFGQQRNNQEFRTADRGDPINSVRYSRLTQDTRAAATGATASASGATAAYTTFNRYLNDLNHSTVDTVAQARRRATLNANRRNAFDQWFTATEDLMYDVYRAIRDTAAAVARTRA